MPRSEDSAAQDLGSEPKTPRKGVWGIALAVALALCAAAAAKALTAWAATAHYPPISPILCAILLGLAWRNLLGMDEHWLSGLQWVSGTLLRIGIALVGLRLALVGIGSVVAVALPVVVGCVLTALLTSVVVGRLMGLSSPMRVLIAAGTAICGCTAVMTVAPVIRAQSTETAVALTCVVILGSVGMLCYPWVAHTMFAHDARLAGVFLGTSIHDTSQVIGASLIYSQQFGSDVAAPVAALTKLLRNSFLLLLPVLALIGTTRAGQSAAGSMTREQVLPTFLLCFLLLAALRTGGDALLAGSTLASAWSVALAAAVATSDFLLICGMTAVGLSVSLKDLRSVGVRAALAALTVALAVGACSLGLTVLMQRLSVAQ